MIVILCNNYMFLSLMILICRVVPVYVAKRTYIHMYEYEQLQLGSCALN